MPQKFGLITGCGKGIGFAIAKKLLLENQNIILLGISRTSNPEIEKLQKDNNNRFIFHKADIVQTEKIKTILENEQKQVGPINFAICNAGMRSRKSLKDSSLNLYRSVIETNTISNINIAKILIEKSLQEKCKCNILLISSIVGSRGFDELSTYAVSKSALEGFMKSAAIEYAKQNIQINCLAPGFIESSFADNFKKKKNYTNGLSLKLPWVDGVIVMKLQI